MNDDDEKVVYFGETDARNRRLKFGIKKKDRSRHLYAIGKTGMGKSTLLENLAVQDIQNGDGICFLDPHGKSADLLLEYVPKERIKDVIYFAPFDMDYPISFNVMEDVGPEKRYLVASGLMAAFKKIWVDAWSARMEYILGNIMLALLEYPGSTLVGVNRMLTDKDFRKEVVSKITDPSVKSFWVNEYASYTEKFAAEAAPAIQNKVGQFIANPLIRNIIGQANSSFDIRKIMDEKKILIINLSKGRVGEANANLLGSMLITKIYLGAMSRADLSEKELAKAPNFYFYVDEFQSFANESFADILSEARKYKLNLHIAHQYIEQMTDEVRAAVFGNVGTMCIFRVGAYDGEVLEKEFTPTFLAEDIVNLQKYQMYLKLMIDGVTSQPFSAFGMSPIPKPEISYVKEIMDSSRSLYAHPRQEVEEEILTWIQKNFANRGGAPTSTSSSSGASSSPGTSGTSSGSNAPRAVANSVPAYSSPSTSRPSSSGGARSPAPSISGSSQNGRPDQRGANNRNSTPSGSGNNGPTSTGGGRNSTPSRGGSEGAYMGKDGPRGADMPQRQPQGQNADQRPQRAPESDIKRPFIAPVAASSTPSKIPSTTTLSQANIPSSNSPMMTSTARSTHSSDRHISQTHTAQVDNKKVDSDKRENELRKAISLSYLKTEEKEKKDPKVPKPENIAALREALLAVMGTSTVAAPAVEALVEKEEVYKEVPEEIYKAVPNVEYRNTNKVTSDVTNEVPNDVQREKPSMEALLDNLENKNKNKPAHTVTNTPADTEVGEDLLKSVFDSE